MDAWLIFWTCMLVVIVSIFAALAIAVAIGGYFDIRALLRDIDAQHEKHKESE